MHSYGGASLLISKYLLITDYILNTLVGILRDF